MSIWFYFWRFCTVFWALFAGALHSWSAELYDPLITTQALLVNALKKHNIISEHRTLTHVSITCKLSIRTPAMKQADTNLDKQKELEKPQQSEHFWVVDVRELIQGAIEARGYNQVIVFNEKWLPTTRMEYVGRPLYCHQNELYMNGPVNVKFQSKEELEWFVYHQQGRPDNGNRIRFNHNGQVIGIDTTDNNQWQGIQ